MLPRPFHGNGVEPDFDTLKQIILDYRAFVGNEVAFHVEYPWWPGKFETRNEELDFHLDEFGRPDDYVTVCSWYDKAIAKLSEVEVTLEETRFSRNVWRALVVLLGAPYAVFWYMM